jgi:hypothetical protein
MATEALRELFARFVTEFDSKELEKGNELVDGLVDKLKGFGKILAGAFAVDAIVGFGAEILHQADAIKDQADALGVSGQHLQEWGHAAHFAGSSAAEFTAAFFKFSRNVNEAGEAAAGPAAKAFKELGVSAKDNAGNLKAPIDLLDEVVAGFQHIQDPAKRTALAMDLFGKSGAKLLPLFKEGPEGIAKLRAEVKELGIGFDDAFLQQSGEVIDSIDRMKLGLKGLAIQLLSAILPGVTEFSKGAVSLTKRVVAWVKSTKLIQAALVALSAKGVIALVRAVPLLIAKLGGLKAVLMALGRFILRVVAPFLILEDIIVFLSGGKSAIGRGLDAAFGPGTAKNIQNLVAEMVRFFGLFKAEPDKVRAAFASLPKDLEEIFGEFGQFLGGWGQGIVELGLFVTNALTGGWANFVAKAKAGGQGILLALNIVWTELKFAGLAAAAALSDAFDGVWNGIISGAQAALNAMLDVLAHIPGTDELVRDLKVKVEGLASAKGSGDARETVDALRTSARLGLASDFDRIGAAATAPASSVAGNVSVVNNTDVKVTVPPGTPAETAQGVAGAVTKATDKGNLRATKAALVPTAG